MSNRQKYDVYLVVHKGDPLDYQKYRHAAIWLVPAEGGSQYYCHVRGVPGDFEYEKRVDYDPRGSRSYAKLINVGRTRVDATSEEITSQLKTTPVKNDNPEFNCQVWVDDAVNRMYRAGYLSKKQYDDGMDGMIEATMEAGDEPT